MSHTRINLSDGWSFKQQDGQSDEWLPVYKVPSQVHMDLLANKKIPDPFVDLNERVVQWVGEKTWLYRTYFKAPVKRDQRTCTTDLVFDGLDTFATVFLNGTKILKTNNMFVAYRTNVTNHLKDESQDNLLEIVFDSALLRGRELVNEHAHEHNFLVRQTESGRLATRKAQYNWGWDWGPILMTAGPWKPVYIEQYEARISDVWIQNEVSLDLRECSGTVYAELDGGLQPGDTLLLSLSKDCKRVYEEEVSVGTDGCPRELLEKPFRLSQPELWYPLGYGAQARYELRAKLVRDGRELSYQSKMIGFRRTELVQEPDAHGKSFYFRINNIDIFSGGSCWIPTDSFLSQISAKRYRDWIALMVESNQVMIRIWGGGVYEDDALLDACDELGVMIWHDFQFACGSYPTYESFLKNFETEARQQIRRLRSHPSMVIWAGNNEDYQVQERYKLEYNYDEDKDPESWLKSTFPARYLYEYLVPKLVQEEDRHTIYHPSSPWGDGKPTADPSVGDIHQWNLWHGAMNKYQEVDALGGRFVSEFGMEAYPHLPTLHAMVSDPAQRFPGSMAMDAHNKAIGHERRMMTYVVENFRLTGPLDLATYAHLTQIVQAETMRRAYKAWRRDWEGRRCGGVLVWQLNDCWPTVSWAVVDYYLVRKPAFYAIARALRPLDVCVERRLHDWTQTDDYVDENSGLKTGQVDHTLRSRGGTFDVWVASSKLVDVEARVSVRFISIGSGIDVRKAITHKVTASPNTTTTVIHAETCLPSIPDAEDDRKPFDMASYDPYVIHVTLSVDGRDIASDTSWPEPIKYLDLSDRGVSFDIVSSSRIVVRAARPVKGFVFEEMQGLKLSDNGFDIVPGVDVTVEVEGCLTADKLRYTFIGAPGASLEVP